jgi:hypothetical protein
MDIDTKEKKQIITRFGEINFKGLEQLEGSYDTYQINDSIDSIRDVIGTLERLLVNIERLKAGARELVDGDSGYCMETFSLEECGDIGTFAVDICDELDDCSIKIDKAHKQLVPLQRLMSTDDDSVYIDYDDSLDEDEEDRDELDDYDDDDENDDD